MTSFYICMPTIVFHSSGLLLVVKFLMDVTGAPLGDVLSNWRVPAWEEAAVITAILALWLALLLFSQVISACSRVLQDTGWPMCIAFYAFGCLLMEAMMALWLLRIENSLPKILMIVTSITTSALGVLTFIYMVYSAVNFVGASIRHRPAVGYGY